MTEDQFDDAEFEHVQPPEWMTAREYLELAAICDIYKVIQKPTFIHKMHWPAHRRLAANGLIKWEERHPDFGPRFAAVSPTDAGISLITETRP